MSNVPWRELAMIAQTCTLATSYLVCKQTYWLHRKDYKFCGYTQCSQNHHINIYAAHSKEHILTLNINCPFLSQSEWYNFDLKCESLVYIYQSID